MKYTNNTPNELKEIIKENSNLHLFLNTFDRNFSGTGDDKIIFIIFQTLSPNREGVLYTQLLNQSG